MASSETSESSAFKPRVIRVLSLDGGGDRCISQLYILQEFMRRIQPEYGEVILPADYFDLIIGVEASGLIATLLGIFRLTPRDAQDVFVKLQSAVFAEPSWSASLRATKMKTMMETFLASNSSVIPTNLLSDCNSGCKVALCYSSTADLASCRVFRNYSSSRGSPSRVPLMDALLACCAEPATLKHAVEIGSANVSELAVSATKMFNNPLEVAIEEVTAAFEPGSRISCILSLGSGHFGTYAADDLHETVQSGILQSMANGESVAEEIRRRLRGLHILFRLSVEHGLEARKLLQGKFGEIKSHTDSYLSTVSTDHLLEQCIDASKRPHSSVTVGYIKNFRQTRTGSSLNLPPLSACFIDRKQSLEDIADIMLNAGPFVQRLGIITGISGSGKSQIALQFAREYASCFQHIFVVNSISSDSIEKGLISSVSKLFPGEMQTIEAVMHILSESHEKLSREWLIIFDDVGIEGDELKKRFFPRCDHGSILITSRNTFLRELAPHSHCQIDAMTEEEASKAFLSIVFPSPSPGHYTSRRSNQVTQATDWDRVRNRSRPLRIF